MRADSSSTSRFGAISPRRGSRSAAARASLVALAAFLFLVGTPARAADKGNNFRTTMTGDRRGHREVLYPHVRSTLTALRWNYKLGVVTNNSTRVVKQDDARLQRSLHLAPGEKVFDSAIGARNDAGSLVRPKKPSPSMLVRTLAELGVSADHAVFVGDAVTDVEAAKRAGMPAIGLTHGLATRSELLKAGADVVVPTFRDVPRAIKATERSGGPRVRAVLMDRDGTYMNWLPGKPELGPPGSAPKPAASRP